MRSKLRKVITIISFILILFVDCFGCNFRYKGSTGLGMIIVYNNVVQKLQGSIELMDSHQGGVHFVMQLPMDVI